MATFGQRLRTLRIENNLTQKDLAKLFKVSESAIGMYERDEREPSFKLTNQIADHFNVTTDYLHGRTNKPDSYETNMSFYGGSKNYTPDEIAVMEATLKAYREQLKKMKNDEKK
ncbi:helix-turn-helix domain-containing protein [Paenibacillus woosongensis]|uniref:Helix-turn-helix domain-containing protein n=1 Tax=Paenibacillus woosongensis TaxID=307580 RepID=A0A7X3CMB6_9BACL|nr:helix-turn-helix transcriptional regulator [Paenibacillus woosongensis]MUG45478.1 helix-turn-helix domain-containing protein [Paenibacillus woosongensis]